MSAQISQFGSSTDSHLEDGVAAHTRLLCTRASRTADRPALGFRCYPEGDKEPYREVESWLTRCQGRCACWSSLGASRCWRSRLAITLAGFAFSAPRRAVR